ncbi:NUDIX domain-containing protein [Paenibacillus sp. N1-5-1-14]|uniref:NUDIX hydrolase n=1 Tax=Paenibacillus radicibacter TaxID=2972488 RepID=UPI002158EFD5|nr:NUDIX domain-containing protein [Paenibacillus radicibacter]MCR8645663.1 NUDIX domain-containing protein [Paenibacillus radicibacter]
MNISWYDLNEIDDCEIKFVVVIAKYRGELILIRNKDRTVWELPGGRREEGEAIIETAKRELYEETGSIIFELTPIGTYLFNESYGMIFCADVEAMSELPAYEIAEIRFSKSLPEGLNYGDVYYKMYDKITTKTINESINIKCDLRHE